MFARGEKARSNLFYILHDYSDKDPDPKIDVQDVCLEYFDDALNACLQSVAACDSSFELAGNANLTACVVVVVVEDGLARVVD